MWLWRAAFSCTSCSRGRKMSKRWISCPVEEEYFGEERKSGKQARKMASAKDRSKYKKSDQRQLAKQQKEVPVDTGHLLRGRVISISSQGFAVDLEGQTILCGLRGVLKKERTHLKNLVTVGDFVLFEKISETEGVIAYVEPRRTLLSRAETLHRRKEQLIAANIEQVLITVSLHLSFTETFARGSLYYCGPKRRHGTGSRYQQDRPAAS